MGVEVGKGVVVKVINSSLRSISSRSSRNSSGRNSNSNSNTRR